MAYWVTRYTSKWCSEVRVTFAGDYGAKGERRRKKEKPTPEAAKRVNQRRREDRVRRLIQCNFDAGDFWITLKYPKGTRKGFAEVNKDFGKYIAIMRKEYRKADAVLKWIARVEIGKRGGIHIHVVMNRIQDLDLIVSDAWQRARGVTPIEEMLMDGRMPADGMAHYDHIRRTGNGKELAEYLTKPLPEQYDEGVEVSDEDRKKMSIYRHSRNLEEPVVERKVYTHWTVKELVDLGAEGVNTKPKSRWRSPGYVIDVSSWAQGVNPYTGLSWVHYTEIPIRRRE